jgi:nicotinic acid mononucleotide adenylyltransferase
VTEEIRRRIIDLRNGGQTLSESRFTIHDSRIYITDAVQIDVSATEIRQKIRDKTNDWHKQVTPEVVKYIEKYSLYLK